MKTKRPSKKSTPLANTAQSTTGRKTLPAHLSYPSVPDSDPMFLSGFAVGGRYPKPVKGTEAKTAE
jgi:hypothetical protein